MSSAPLADLERIIKSAGFDAHGFAALTRPVSIAFYQQWLGKGYQADMTYLERHFSQKANPQLLMRQAQSAIVVTKNYVPHPEELSSWPLKDNRGIAAYARGRDYHHFLKAKLHSVIEELKALWPDEEFVAFTDSAPVLERDLAARAGLGWIGKNTCLISRKHGSLFLIAEIYSSLRLPTAGHGPSPDHCGTCRRCLDACPTGALVAPRELDARKCISYLTIESRTLPPEWLREKMGDWLFGCDICQNVCPWNRKVIAPKDARSPLERENLIADLRFLLTSTNRALERAFKGTPLLRAGGTGLKRNALIVAGNMRATEVREEIKALLSHPRLGALARWSIEKLLDPHEPLV